jgi:hypothetical protein
MPQTRSAAPAAKRGRLFYLGISGIASGGVFCILSVVAFILAAYVNQKAAPQASVLPVSNPTATILPATETGLPVSPEPTTTIGSGVEATQFSDDFSNTNGGWYVGSTDNFDANYFQGNYDMGVRTPKYYFVSLLPDPFPDPIQNIIVTVRGKLAPGNTGEIGVVCRYQDIDNFYLAAISGDRFYIGKQVNGAWTYLTSPNLQPLPDSTPDQDGYLSIGFSCIDSFIVLEVNGIGAAHFTDEELSAGNIGLYVYGGDQIGQSGYYAQGYFDDFSAELPAAP